MEAMLNKRVFVARGSQGIGRGIVEAFLSAGRVGKPDDIAQACLFLSNPDNNFINGQNLVIDRGMTKKMIYV